MKTVDITVGDLVHQLQITYGGTRTRVQPCCDHGVPEEVLMALCGIELHCEWLAAILQCQLRLRVPLEEASSWARLPVSPTHPHPMALWKAPNHKRPWSLKDLEGWRKDGRTPEQAADFCARYPHRVHYAWWPS